MAQAQACRHGSDTAVLQVQARILEDQLRQGFLLKGRKGT